MKKNVSFIILISISAIFLACSNNQTLKVSYQDLDTIKEILIGKEADTRWAAELEGTRLTDSLLFDPQIITREIQPTPQTVKILKEYKDPVFANIKDFGNLDNTLLTNNQKKFVNDFMTFVSTKYNQNSADFFVSEYNFNYQFFINDLKNAWKDNYEEDFPEILEKEENNTALFTKWIIGEPTKFENQILIPIHAYTKKGYVNLLLSTNNDVTIKLYNVQIERWGN